MFSVNAMFSENQKTMDDDIKAVLKGVCCGFTANSFCLITY